jgi:hypothetical protein
MPRAVVTASATKAIFPLMAASSCYPDATRLGSNLGRFAKRASLISAMPTLELNREYPPMTETITVDVPGGCPKCGNSAIIVPEDYTDDTIVSCPKCDYKTRRKDVFGDDDEA